MVQFARWKRPQVELFESEPNDRPAEPIPAEIFSDPKLWFALAHWAKVGDFLTPYLRKAAADLGKKTQHGGLSEKQMNFMLRIYRQAVKAGFIFDSKGGNSG